MATTRRLRSRTWCFTVNNNARAFYDGLRRYYEANIDSVRYICGQLERASTGQLHFQGYIQLLSQRGLSWLKDNVDRGAHFEKQRGTNTEAKDYCNKADTRQLPFIEFGEFTKGAGARMDLIAFKKEIQKGVTQKDLLENYTMCMAKFPKFYNLVRGLKRPTRTNELTVRLNFGDTGLGKSRYAYDNFPLLYAIPLTSSSLWFDGYDLHQTVLLDDFAGASSKVTLNYTLQLLDRYPVQVPVKGGFTWWMPDLIIITTNIHPRLWYKWEDRQGQYKALMRRITEIFLYEEGEDERGIQDEDREDFIGIVN